MLLWQAVAIVLWTTLATVSTSLALLFVTAVVIAAAYLVGALL